MRANENMKQHFRQMHPWFANSEQLETTWLMNNKSKLASVLYLTLRSKWEWTWNNENIKTFDDLLRHLKLEAERLEVIKANGLTYTDQSGSRKPSGIKILNLCLRRKILPSAREASAVVKMAKLAHHALTVARKDTSLVIALSRRRYFLTWALYFCY